MNDLNKNYGQDNDKSQSVDHNAHKTDMNKQQPYGSNSCNCDKQSKEGGNMDRMKDKINETGTKIKHSVQETATKVGNRVQETAQKVGHKAEEWGQQVADNIKEKTQR